MVTAVKVFWTDDKQKKKLSQHSFILIGYSIALTLFKSVAIILMPIYMLFYIMYRANVR